MNGGDYLKVIYVISPTYLKALYKEALKYDFVLQGYGNVTNARRGLGKVNISDILGFAYVNTRLPQDLEPLRQFMELCGTLAQYREKPTKFIFALENLDRLDELFDRDYQNLLFSYLPNVEVFTDIEFNRKIFGSILKDNYNPYELVTKEKVNHELSKKDLLKLQMDFPALRYVPAINPNLLRVLQDYHHLKSFDSTLANDEVFQDFSDFNEFYAGLRKIFLSLKFINKEFKSSWEVMVKFDVEKIIEDLKKDLVRLEGKLEDTALEKDTALGEDAESVLANQENFILTKSIILHLRKELISLWEIYNCKKEVK